jgi:phosphohistidine phosphatase SixA
MMRIGLVSVVVAMIGTGATGATPLPEPLAPRDSRPATQIATRDSPLATRVVARDPRPATSDTLIVFLIRHAEKADDSRDPPLSDAGKQRAEGVARLLGDAGITRVWSTNLLRTRHTAQPLAERLGLPVETYDPMTLDAFADGLRRRAGRHLVVGHSNTTPDLVKALGGTPGDAIQDNEYDRLYVLVCVGESVTTTLLRFGAAPAREEPSREF